MNDVPPGILLQQFLIDQSICTEVTDEEEDAADWQVYSPALVDGDQEKDNAVGIQNTTATPDGRLHKTGEVIEHPGIQIIVRAKTHDVGFVKGRAIEVALSETLRGTSVTITFNSVERTFRLDSFMKTSSLTFMGYTEKKQRAWFTINGCLTCIETTV